MTVPRNVIPELARWHRYDLIKPSPHVEPLLAEIENDPTSIFWG